MSWFFSIGFIIKNLKLKIRLGGKIEICDWLRQNAAAMSAKALEVHRKFSVTSYTV